MDNEVTIGTQIKSVLWSHLYTSLVTGVFGLGAFWWFLVQNNWKELYSVICIAIYFCVMYMKGEKLAVQDKRSVSKLKPYPLKGVVLSLSVAAVTFILWLLYRMTWVYMTIDGDIWGWSGVVYNVAFLIWSFCYNGLMHLYLGGMLWYMHIVIYTIPALALGLGYFAGYKGFSISEHFAKKMYEDNTGKNKEN